MGRPKGSKNNKSFIELMRAHVPEAIDVLVELLHSEDDAVRFRAASNILDRAHGRPQQHMVHRGLNPDEVKKAIGKQDAVVAEYDLQSDATGGIDPETTDS